MKRAWMSALVLATLVGCGAIPERGAIGGASVEVWERLKRENPNKAQVLEWVHKDEARMQLLAIWVEKERAHPMPMGEEMFLVLAEREMLGAGQGGLKAAVTKRIQEERKYFEERLQDQGATQDERDAAKVRIPACAKALAAAEAVKG